MTLFPIVARELRAAARRPALYRTRGCLALAAVGVFVFALFVLARDAVPSTEHGIWLFRTLLTISFVFCLFAGAGLTADCISVEKREGTLGLLFLTDLKGFDVVLGKLAASSLNAVYGLVATLPVHVLTVQLGGVTAAELVRSACFLLNTLFFSLAVGLFVSTISQDERKAMFATGFFVFLAALLPAAAGYIFLEFVGGARSLEPAILGILSFSPAYGLQHLLLGSTRALPVPTWLFWSSVGWIHLTSWALLTFASLRLPWVWQTRDRKTGVAQFEERLEQRLYGEGVERRRFRHRLLTQNPFLWLAQRERGKPLYVWVYLAAVGGTWLWGRMTQGDVMFDPNSVLPTVLVVHGFFKVWVVSEACTRLAHDRANGALELLLSTPLTPAEVLRGQWLALRRQFLKPLLALALAEFLLLARAVSGDLALMSVILLVADFLALGWVGMWLGLSAKNLTRALLGTVLLLLVLPWLLSFALVYLQGTLPVLRHLPSSSSETLARSLWFAIGLLNSAGWGWFWARRRLRRGFRQVAMRRYQAPAETGLGGLLRREAGGAWSREAPAR